MSNLLQIPQLQEYYLYGGSIQPLDINQYDEAFMTFTSMYQSGSNTYSKFVVLKIFKETSGYYAKVLSQTQYTLQTSVLYTGGLVTQVREDYVYTAGTLDILTPLNQKEAFVLKMDRFGNYQSTGGVITSPYSTNIQIKIYEVQVISNEEIHYFIVYRPTNLNYIRINGSSSLLSFSGGSVSNNIIQSQPDRIDSNILRSVITTLNQELQLQTFNFSSGIASNKKLSYYAYNLIYAAQFTGSTDSDKLYIGGSKIKEFVYSSINQWNTFTNYQGFIQVQRANGDKDTNNDCTADLTSNNTVSNIQFTNITNATSENVYPYISANFYAENDSQLAIELIASFESLDILDNLRFITSQLACHPDTAITSPNLSSFKVGYYDSTNQTKTFTFADIYIDSSLYSTSGLNRNVEITASTLNIGQYNYIYKAKVMPINLIVEIPFTLNVTQGPKDPCLLPKDITDIVNNDTLQINYTLGQQLNFALLDWYYLGGSNVTCQYYSSLSVLPIALIGYASYDSVTQIFQLQATAFNLTSSSPYSLILSIFNENNTTLTTLTFTISIKGCDVSLIDVQKFNDQQYVIGKNTLNIEITPWIGNCDLIEYTISVIRNDGQSYKDFISISNDQTAVQILSSKPQDQGQYRITIIGTLQHFQPFLSSFNLDVKLQCTLTPSSIQTPQRYKVGKSKNIMFLPFQSEYCQDPITYDSLLAGGYALPNFITFGEGRFSIETNNLFIEKSYDIQLIGRIQSENIEEVVKFTIDIQFPQVQRVNNITNQAGNSNATKTPVISSDFYTLSAKVTSISQTGIVSISFNPEFKLLSNYPEENKKHFSFDISKPDSDEKMDNNQFSFNILEIRMLFINNGGQAGSSTKILIVGNLFFNLFMSTSLQYLWGMINQIQIITHLPINAVEIPSNTKFFFNIIIDICNFNIIPSDDMLNGIITVKETYAFNDYFQEMDIFQKNKLNSFISQLFKVIKLEFDDLSSTISSLASILVLFITLASLIFTIFFLLQNSNQQLKRKDLKAKYGSLYDGVKLYTNSKLPLIQNIIFIFRRIMLCTLQIVTDQGCIQIISNTLLSMFVIMYLIHVRPFKQQFQNKLEIFNEICIMLINYHMLYFLEPNGYSDSDILYSIGFTAIGVTAFSFIANTSITFAISLKLMIKDLIQLYKKKCKKQLKHNQQGSIELSGQTQNESKNKLSSLKYKITMTSQAELLDSKIKKAKRSKLVKYTMEDKKAKNTKSKMGDLKKDKKKTQKANLKNRKISIMIAEDMRNKQEVINEFFSHFENNIPTQDDLVCQSYSNDNDTTIAQIYRPSIILSDYVETEKPVTQIKNRVQEVKLPKKKMRKIQTSLISQCQNKKGRNNPLDQDEVKQGKKVKKTDFIIDF
eukprot:403346330